MIAAAGARGFNIYPGIESTVFCIDLRGIVNGGQVIRVFAPWTWMLSEDVAFAEEIGIRVLGKSDVQAIRWIGAVVYVGVPEVRQPWIRPGRGEGGCLVDQRGIHFHEEFKTIADGVARAGHKMSPEIVSDMGRDGHVFQQMHRLADGLEGFGKEGLPLGILLGGKRMKEIGSGVIPTHRLTEPAERWQGRFRGDEAGRPGHVRIARHPAAGHAVGRHQGEIRDMGLVPR